MSGIFSRRLLLGVEREVKGVGRACGQCKARPYTTKVTRALCDDNFLRIAPHTPYSPDLASSDLFLFSWFLVFLFGHLKNAFKDSNSGLQMNFFRESEKFWAKSALTLWKQFSGSGSTDWTDVLQHCSIAALRQMEST
jgi:hypothetical protein